MINKLIKAEKKKGFFTKKGFVLMNKKFYKRKENFNKFLKKFKNQNICAYGASGPATSMIYFYKLQNKINYLVDDNPLRINRYSPGSSIKVHSSKKLLKLESKFVIILAWRFTKEIISRNKSFLKNGGKFISIHPKIKII